MSKLMGKVAAILNSRELVINLGQSSGIREGMVFRVLDEERIVRDPDTEEELGMVRREKIRVKITDVQKRLSIARTFETYKVNLGGIGMPSNIFGNVSDLFAPADWVTRVRTLRYENTGVEYEPLEEGQSLVKVGDIVEEEED